MNVVSKDGRRRTAPATGAPGAAAGILCEGVVVSGGGRGGGWGARQAGRWAGGCRRGAAERGGGVGRGVSCVGGQRKTAARREVRRGAQDSACPPAAALPHVRRLGSCRGRACRVAGACCCKRVHRTAQGGRGSGRRHFVHAPSWRWRRPAHPHTHPAHHTHCLLPYPRHSTSASTTWSLRGPAVGTLPTRGRPRSIARRSWRRALGPWDAGCRHPHRHHGLLACPGARVARCASLPLPDMRACEAHQPQQPSPRAVGGWSARLNGLWRRWRRQRRRRRVAVQRRRASRRPTWRPKHCSSRRRWVWICCCCCCCWCLWRWGALQPLAHARTSLAHLPTHHLPAPPRPPSCRPRSMRCMGGCLWE